MPGALPVKAKAPLCPHITVQQLPPASSTSPLTCRTICARPAALAGAGLSVFGGYNILMAHNTLYRVGQRSHLLELLYGSRSCDGDTLVGGNCATYPGLGGWGPTANGACSAVLHAAAQAVVSAYAVV